MGQFTMDYQMGTRMAEKRLAEEREAERVAAAANAKAEREEEARVEQMKKDAIKRRFQPDNSLKSKAFQNADKAKARALFAPSTPRPLFAPPSSAIPSDIGGNGKFTFSSIKQAPQFSSAKVAAPVTPQRKQAAIATGATGRSQYTGRKLFAQTIESPPQEYDGPMIVSQIPYDPTRRANVFGDSFLNHLVPENLDEEQRRQYLCILDLRRLKYGANEIFTTKDWRMNVVNFAKEFEKSRSLILAHYGLYKPMTARVPGELLKQWQTENDIAPEYDVDDNNTPIPSRRYGSNTPHPRGSTKRRAEDDLQVNDTPTADRGGLFGSAKRRNMSTREPLSETSNGPTNGLSNGVSIPAPSAQPQSILKRTVEDFDEDEENSVPHKIQKSTGQHSVTWSAFNKVVNETSEAANERIKKEREAAKSAAYKASAPAATISVPNTGRFSAPDWPDTSMSSTLSPSLFDRTTKGPDGEPVRVLDTTTGSATVETPKMLFEPPETTEAPKAPENFTVSEAPKAAEPPKYFQFKPTGNTETDSPNIAMPPAGNAFAVFGKPAAGPAAAASDSATASSSAPLFKLGNAASESFIKTPASSGLFAQKAAPTEPAKASATAPSLNFGASAATPNPAEITGLSGSLFAQKTVPQTEAPKISSSTPSPLFGTSAAATDPPRTLGLSGSLFTQQAALVEANKATAPASGPAFGASTSAASPAKATGLPNSMFVQQATPFQMNKPSSSAPSLTFGASAVNNGAAKTSGLSSSIFGQSNAHTESPKPSTTTPALSFGASTSAADPVKNTESTKSIFDKPAASSKTPKAPSSTPSVLFGNSATPADTNEAPAFPSFSFGTPATVSSTPQNPFSAPSFSFSAPAPTQPGGASPAPASMSSFSFGTPTPSQTDANKVTTAPANASSFTFGASTPSQIDANTTPASASSFTFGQSSASQPMANPFAAPPNMFASHLALPQGGNTTGTNTPLFGGASSMATTPAGGTPEPEAKSAEEQPADDDGKPQEQVSLTDDRPGEEDEDVVFEIRAKAIKFKPAPKDSDDEGAGKEKNNNPWKTQGIGNLRVLKHKTTGTVRLLLRAEPRGAIALNRALLPNADYKCEGDAKFVKITTGSDSGKGLETWMLQVKTHKAAEELASILEANKGEKGN